MLSFLKILLLYLYIMYIVYIELISDLNVRSEFQSILYICILYIPNAASVIMFYHIGVRQQQIVTI